MAKKKPVTATPERLASYLRLWVEDHLDEDFPNRDEATDGEDEYFSTAPEETT